MTPDIPDCVPLTSSAGPSFLGCLVGPRLLFTAAHAKPPKGTTLVFAGDQFARIIDAAQVPTHGRLKLPDAMLHLLDRDVVATYPSLAPVPRNADLVGVDQYRKTVQMRLGTTSPATVQLKPVSAKQRFTGFASGSPVFSKDPPFRLLTVLRYGLSGVNASGYVVGMRTLAEGWGVSLP